MGQSENLAEYAKMSAEQTGVTLEEASSTINGILAVFESIRNAFSTIINRAKEIFENLQQRNMKQRSKPIHHINWDTRKKSQVLDNRPAFVVRKVIGR